MKILVKTQNSKWLPKIIDKGDWVDLCSAEEVKLDAPTAKEGKVTFSKKLISLGVAMQLPPGFEAVAVPRSSTFSKFKVLLANSFGVIDNTYCGNNDIWAFNAIAFDKTVIHKGDRICQFKVQLSQKATWWQKLKWLFDSKVEFVPVDDLQNPDRHGFGSTGTK